MCIHIYIYGQRFFLCCPPLFLMLASLWFILYAGAVLFLCWGGPFFMLGALRVPHPAFFKLQGVFLYAARG